MNSLPGPIEPKRRLSWWHLLLGFLAVNAALIAVCGLGAWWWLAQSARKVNEELARIRAAGEPATAEDLNALPGPPVDSDVTEMLIPILAQFETPAFHQDSKAVPLVGAENQQPIPPVGQPWPDLEAAEALLARYEAEMKGLHKAMERGGAANFPKDFRDGFRMLLPNVQRLRAAARMLMLEAHVRAHRGDAAGAADSMRGLLMLNRSIENEHILVSQLVRMAISSMGVRLVEEMLPHVEFSDEDLSRLQEALRADDFQAGLTKALLGERAMGVRAMQDPQSIESSADLETGQIREVFLPAQADSPFYLQMMREIVAASRMPFPQANAEIRRIEAHLKNEQVSNLWQMQHRLSLMLLPSMKGSFDATARALAARDAADAAIAAELYRRKHGAFPNSLAELAPEFLMAAPIDPVDGQPLRYRRTDRGFMIYSIGRDGVDDGGKGSLGDDPDLVFKLEKD